MSDIPKTHHEKLKGHIADGEKAIDTYSFTEELDSEIVSEKTYLLTNRRFVIFRRKAKSGVTTVQSTFLDTLGGAKIRHVPETKPDQSVIIAGVLALLFGLFSIGSLGRVSSNIAVLFLVIGGAAAVILGIYLLADAYDTEDGTVSIQLQTSEGKTALSVTLDDRHLEFAELISEAVSDTRS